ncbi:MAG: hypothetical protein OCD76_19980 [Reichenbachiella sp.]
MRKSIYIILILSVANNLSAQNYDDTVGSLHLSLTRHEIKYDKEGLPTKKITNSKNRPYLKIDFDSRGTTLKKESYGKHHNTDLRLTDMIEIFSYKDDKLVESIEHESDYESNVFPKFRTKYTYNDSSQLVDESTYYFKSDSLFFRTTFEYDIRDNRTRSIFNPSYYYLREFDSLNQLISLKQIHENKVRWKWVYSYTDTTRTGEFQTFYTDGKNNPKKEIRRFIGTQLLEVEEIGIIHTLKKFYYYENGQIKRISEYRKRTYYEMSPSEIKLTEEVNTIFDATEDFEPIRYTTISSASNAEIPSEVIQKLNSNIDW